MEFVFNPVIISVILLCSLCLMRVNVLLALMVSAIVAGLSAKMPVGEIMSTFVSGMGGNSETALSYILLGAFAAAMSHTGLAPLIAKKIATVIKGKAFVLLADSVLLPAAKALQNISNTFQNIANSVVKTLNEIKQKIIDIADKLTAMFGEAKAAIKKKIEEKFKDIKKKIFNLFGLASADNEEDEEARKIEEAKQLFELNTAKEALFELLENPDKESPSEESEQA